MIRLKFFVRSLLLLLTAAALCAGGASAEEGDMIREFNEWRETVAEKWRPFEELDLGSEWFSCYRLPSDVYAFYEMPYEQDACCFLILGEDKALLWDTGMGIGRLRSLTEKITDLPIVVLNSHDHFDHIGGNAEFDEV